MNWLKFDKGTCSRALWREVLSLNPHSENSIFRFTGKEIREQRSDRETTLLGKVSEVVTQIRIEVSADAYGSYGANDSQVPMCFLKSEALGLLRAEIDRIVG